MPVAQAATIGKTVVTSAQHQPLVAIISVADISAENFSASLANPVIYQQMGLTPTDSMSVRFVPTSATTGTVVISTTQPVSMPFTDVILAVNDNGRRDVIPKTLLMPLAKSVPIKQSGPVIASASKPNLPIVTARSAQPLAVKRGAPPPLFISPSPQSPELKMPSTRMANAQAQVVLPDTTASISAPITSSRLVTSPLSSNAITKSSIVKSAVANDQLTGSASRSIQPTQTQSTSKSAPQSDSRVAIATNASLNARLINDNAVNLKVSNPTQSIDASLDVTPKITDDAATLDNLTTPPRPPATIAQTAPTAIVKSISKPFDILSIQVSRQIKLNTATAVSSRPLILVNTAPELIAKPTAKIKSTAAKVEDTINADMANADMATAADIDASSAVSTTPVQNTVPATAVSYTVQRNDNLWIIAQQIALQNEVDVQTVMTQIQQQNPDAFIAQDANRLKANAQLSLPTYETIPSQKSLQVAIAAQRQSYRQGNRPLAAIATDPLDDKNSATTAVTTQATAAKVATARAISPKTTNTPKTVIKTLPQAQFSVLAPGRDGSASGTQSKAANATNINTNISTDILSTLQASRQRTATQAKQVQATNSTLGGYVKKLKLQNQKLAELEARLKKLRNQ